MEMCGNVENMSRKIGCEAGLKGKHLFFKWSEGKIWGEQNNKIFFFLKTNMFLHLHLGTQHCRMQTGDLRGCPR